MRIKDAISKSKVGLETLQNSFQTSNQFFNTNDSNDSPHNESDPKEADDDAIENPDPPSHNALENENSNAIQLVGGFMIGLPSLSLLQKKG